MLANAFKALSRMLWLPLLWTCDTRAADTAGAEPIIGVQPTTVAADNLHSGYLLQLVAGLFFVLLCIVALAWLAKRVNRFHTSADGAIQVLGGISMGARERVVLVQVGSAQLLLGVAPGRIDMLHQLEQPVAVADDAMQRSGAMPVARGFAEKLNAALSRYK